MSSTRSRTGRRLVATGAVLGLLISLVVGLAGVSPASATIGSACTGANTQPGAFTDAGLAANCLKAYGIALGKNDGTFGEDDNLIRAQFASFATRFLTAASVAHTARTTFSDVNANTVPDANVRQEIEEGHAAGVVNGFADGTFKPQDNMSVAQAATIVLNLAHAIHVANSSAPDLAPVNDPATGKPDTAKSYDAAVQAGILDLTAKDKAGTTYPNGKTDTTKRGLFADVLAELLQKEVDAHVIPNALVVTEAPAGTSSPTVRTVNLAGNAFTSTDSLSYFYDSNDTFELKGTTIDMATFEGLLNPDDVLTVTYDPNSTGVSDFNITTDVVHAVSAPSARTVGSPSPGQDVQVSVVLPTNNNTDVVYQLQRSNTSCVDPTPFSFSDVTTAGDDISDGTQTDKNVSPGCYVYRVEAMSNSDPGATVADGADSNQVTVPTSDNTPPTITDVHATGDTNGMADTDDTHVFTFSEAMDSGLGANGTTYRLQDGDGTQVDIVCGTNATCTLDSTGFDPGPPPFNFSTLTVKLTGAPTIVAPGTTAGLQYGANGATIISVDGSFKDAAGNPLDLNNSDRLIERQ